MNIIELKSVQGELSIDQRFFFSSVYLTGAVYAAWTMPFSTMALRRSSAAGQEVDWLRSDALASLGLQIFLGLSASSAVVALILFFVLQLMMPGILYAEISRDFYEGVDTLIKELELIDPENSRALLLEFLTSDYVYEVDHEEYIVIASVSLQSVSFLKNIFMRVPRSI